MIRATTGGVMKTYRSNLMNSFIGMNKSMNTILSQRTFNSFAEDPAAAAKAFRLRKSRMMLESQHSICTDVLKKYSTAQACLQSIDDVLCTKEGEYGYYMNTLTGTTLSMLNDPEGDAREQLTKVLDQMSQQVIQTMNQKYGDNFIFAGADGHNVPFEIRQVDGKDRLFYRGVPVDACIPNVMTQTAADGTENLVAVDGTGKIIDDLDDAIASGEQIYYFSMDNVETVSKAEFDKQIAYTKVATDNTSGDPVAYKFVENEAEDNGGHYEQITAGDDYDGTVYYQLTDQDGNGNDVFITEEEYAAAKEFVSSNSPLLYSDNTDAVPVDASGNLADDGKYYLIIRADSLMPKEDYEQQKLDYEKLQYLAGEKNFVDIGYGFQEDPITGKLIESSAFNEALNGINFLGWGIDEEGDPLNIYSLVQKMREVAETASANDSWKKDWDEFNRLVGKFEKAVSNYQTEFVNLDASTGKLSSQEELLTENYDNVWEQYSNIEDVDMAEAITAFLWAQYSYNAALRVGNSVLSQSLMDYLS